MTHGLLGRVCFKGFNMIKKIFLFCVIFNFYFCKQEVIEPQIITRYLVRDEITSPLVVGCEDFEIKDFLEIEDNVCNFKVGNDTFDILECFRLNGKKEIKEFCRYYSEGQLCMDRNEFMEDSLFCDSHNLNTYSLIIDLKNQIIIENNDTMKVVNINEKYKLIFAKFNKRDNTKVVFQYD